MKAKPLLKVLPFLLLLSSIGASQTYCTDLFNNVHGIVNSNIYTLSTFNDLISFTGLIIIVVIMFMSLIYGLGIALGLDSFKQFAKTEYLESAVNLLILLFVVGAVFTANGFTSFFSNLSSSTVPSTTGGVTTYSGGGIKNLYINICNNILNLQVFTGALIIFGTFIELVGYNLLAGINIGFSFSGKNGFSFGNLLPSVSITPLAGLGITVGFIYNEFSALSGFIGLSIATILLLFVIYFLFPLLFYVGVLLRSFPWTRAAGGSLIALFVSFFLIFPSVFSVFTFSTATNIISTLSQLCGSPTAAGASASSGNICITSSPSNSNLVAFAQNFGISSLSSASSGSFLLGFLFKNGVGFDANITLYSEEVGFYVLMFVGMFIAFIISYDMLGLLSKLLGSPSFNGKKIFGKIV